MTTSIVENHLNCIHQGGIESVERAVLERLPERGPFINYMVDKGWQHAISHFARSVLSGEPPRSASVHDGLMAVRLVYATAKSMASNAMVRLEQALDC